MKSYYREFLNFDAANRYCVDRRGLGHNTCFLKCKPLVPDAHGGYRVYFSAGIIDYDAAMPLT